jgi:hypothetical protein
MGTGFEGVKTPDEIYEEKLYKKARWIASLVQGSQILEGAGLDEAGMARLVEVGAEALRQRDPNKTLFKDDDENLSTS